MSTFVLVHGAWHGAWCWQKLIPLLAAKGHKVVAPDLPGLGQDKMPAQKISLKSYTDRIGEIIDRQNGPVILVGHSMGGIVITQLAEYIPEKIECLVYLNGMLPRNGEFLLYLAEKLSLDQMKMTLSEDKSVSNLDEEIVGPIFYTDCSEADVEMAKAFLCPQAMAPFAKAVRISEESFGSVRKVYISCKKDQAIPPAAQNVMLKNTPCDQVISMEAGHSPFLSAPGLLAEHLISII